MVSVFMFGRLAYGEGKRGGGGGHQGGVNCNRSRLLVGSVNLLPSMPTDIVMLHATANAPYQYPDCNPTSSLSFTPLFNMVLTPGKTKLINCIK
jgi:hypothetical protein